MVCKNCNNNLPDDSEFCQYCGNKIERYKTPKIEEPEPSISYNNVNAIPKSSLFNKNLNVVNYTLLALSILSIMFTIIVMNIQDIDRDTFEEISPSVFYGLNITVIVLSLLTTGISTYKTNREKQIITTSITSLLYALGVICLSFEEVWSENYYYRSQYVAYGYSDNVNVLNTVIIILDILMLAIVSSSFILMLCKVINKYFRSTIRYREKCYKRIEKMHNYYKDGIITQEEYETVKNELLNGILK